jgi:mannose-6-phosphate isomerase class I
LQAGYHNFFAMINSSRINIWLLDGLSALDWAAVRERASSALAGFEIYDFDHYRKNTGAMDTLFSNLILDHSHFNRYFQGCINDLFDPEKLSTLRAEVIDALAKGQRALVIGSGSSLLEFSHSSLVWLSASHVAVRRNLKGSSLSLFGASVFPGSSSFEYVDHLIINSHLQDQVASIDWLVDHSEPDSPTFVSTDALRKDLAYISSRPFRVQPIFFAKSWGGHWLKDNLPIQQDLLNTAGSFEFAQFENDLVLTDNDLHIRLPLDFVVASQAKALIGSGIVDCFGAEFPLRLNLTDTIGGQNLSCQVHPDVDFTRETYSINAGVDEKYYVIRAENGACINLGLKDDADLPLFKKSLENSEKSGSVVPIEQSVCAWPSKKGTIFLLPPGTVHNICTGNLVMEIISSNTIFTFRLYDYLRKDESGDLRPLHISEASQVIDPSINASMAKERLIPVFRPVSVNNHQESTVPVLGNSYTTINKIEWSGDFYASTMKEVFHLLTLVEGTDVNIEWEGGSSPLHFLETILVPADTGPYHLISPAHIKSIVLKVSVSV